MGFSICGLDCAKCDYREACGGCAATEGRPFGADCILARCCHAGGHSTCDQCADAKPCRYIAETIDEFNELHVADMPKLTGLNALKGSIVNLEYTLPSGQAVKIFDDDRIILGNQVCKSDHSERCYGLAADENYLLVCEFGEGGADPEIVIYKRRRNR
ncbi:DUF3795 domain-containing protein [Candidatus Sumerlaeota bacterium]|nr:DUF3795 domain-containing protein [Candidatus Sumerlaeota bacterium]